MIRRRRFLPMNSTDYNNMTIGMLRDKLLLKQQQQQQSQQQQIESSSEPLSSTTSNQNHYLEILDGTRSMLIQRLKE